MEETKTWSWFPLADEYVGDGILTLTQKAGDFPTEIQYSPRATLLTIPGGSHVYVYVYMYMYMHIYIHICIILIFTYSNNLKVQSPGAVNI